MSLMWKRFVTTTDGAQRRRRARGVGGAREERGVSGGLLRRGKELDVKPKLIVGGEAASERLALVQAQLVGTAAAARVCGSCGGKEKACETRAAASAAAAAATSSCAPDATAAKFEPADAHPSAKPRARASASSISGVEFVAAAAAADGGDSSAATTSGPRAHAASGRKKVPRTASRAPGAALAPFITK